LASPLWVYGGIGANARTTSAVQTPTVVSTEIDGTNKPLFHGTIGTATSVLPGRQLARVDQATNQELTEVLEKSDRDPQGLDQLMKEAIQAMDLGLTSNGTGNWKIFTQQLQLIMGNAMAVTKAIGSQDPKSRIDGATAAL
jgi:hypothetical protein